jgi:hypothetical protein
MANQDLQWILYKFIKGEFTLLSKPFKTKGQAEKARARYPEREQRQIGIGVTQFR